MKIIKNTKQKVTRLFAFLMVTFISLMSYAPICLANGDSASAEEVANKVTAPMNSLIIVVVSVVQVIGVFILVKNVSELVHSIQDRDSSGIWQAGRGLAAAALLISIRWIIQLFGYTF